MEKVIEIKVEDIKRAFDEANDNVKNCILNLFPQIREILPITDRVKTFEDACRELGEDNHLVEQYRLIEENADFTSDCHDIFTYLKLRIVFAALNEGWKPQFTKDEWRYYPRFELCTNMALTAKSDEWKASRHIASIEDYLGYYEYIVCTGSNTANPNITPLAGWRLCFKNADLAIYFGAQFINLWVDFCLTKKK